MLKLLGIILIFLSSAGTGFFLNIMLCEKSERLILTEKFINEILNDLKHKKTPTDTLLKNLKKDKKYKKLLFLNELNFNCEPEKAIEKAVNKQKNLSKEEKEIFMEIGKILGSYDSDSQINLLNLQQKNLQITINEALRDKKEKGKLFSSFGVLFGIFLTILIL